MRGTGDLGHRPVSPFDLAGGPGRRELDRRNSCTSGIIFPSLPTHGILSYIAGKVRGPMAAFFIEKGFMKNDRGMKIKHHKQRGEWAEMRFMACAAEHGLQVSKPWGDSASYDFVVEHDTRCVRVQVKSTMHQRHGRHCCQVRGSQRRSYVDDSFDFAAVYLIPEDVWYIIPSAQIAGQTSLFFSPKMRNSKYSMYKEAWHLLRTEPQYESTLAKVEACAGASASLW